MSTWLTLLKCAGHSHKILGRIVKLIGSYTHKLSRYLEYAKEFIGYPRLDEALISMYMAYLDTCIRAANFLDKNAYGMTSLTHRGRNIFSLIRSF